MFKPKMTQYMKAEKELIILRGKLNGSFTVPLIDLNSSSYISKKRNRISYFIVESFQNLLRHGVGDSELSEDNTIFAISKSEDQTRFCSVNLIEGKSSVALNQRIDKLKVLSIDDLNELYQDQLQSAILSNEGGAGLGLIDMARKSSGKLSHEIVNENETLKKFIFETRLGTTKESDNELKCHDYLKFMTINDLFFYRKGNNSSDNFKQISTMLLQELRVNSAKKRTKFLECAVFEMLDNVNKHAIVSSVFPQSVYLKRFADGQLGFYTKNVISNNQVAAFKLILDFLNNISVDSANDLYFERVISNVSYPRENCAPMGLLRVRKKLETDLIYDFEKINDEISYVTIGVKT